MNYTHPLNIVTLLIGIGLLLLGADYYHAEDWDYGVSILMALMTYFTAPYLVETFVSKDRLGNFVLAGFFTWWSVDGCYALYWSIMNPEALALRDIQWIPSLCAYIFCGMLWYYLPIMFKGKSK